MKKDGKVIDYYTKYISYIEKQQSGFGLSNKRYKQMKKLSQWFANDSERLAQLQRMGQVFVIGQ